MAAGAGPEPSDHPSSVRAVALVVVVGADVVAVAVAGQGRGPLLIGDVEDGVGDAAEGAGGDVVAASRGVVCGVDAQEVRGVVDQCGGRGVVGGSDGHVDGRAVLVDRHAGIGLQEVGQGAQAGDGLVPCEQV